MADRHFVNGGVDNLWGTIGNWSLTEGGAGGQTVPTAAQSVAFDAGSPICTIDASARVCLTLTTAAYTKTLTFDQQLSVSGSITIGASTGFAGTTTNRLRMIAAGTWTTNAKTIPQDIEIGGTTTFTCTLADALTTSGTLYLTNTTSTVFAGNYHITAANMNISGTQSVTVVHDVTVTGTLTVADAWSSMLGAWTWYVGGLTMTGGIAAATVGAGIVMTGGTWQGSGAMVCNLTIAGDVTVSGAVSFGTTTRALTYSSGSGTVTTTGSTLTLDGSCVLDTAGISWNNVTIGGSGVTMTNNSLLTVTGTLTLPDCAYTFAGTAGWTAGTLAHTAITNTRIYTFEEGLTYTVTTAMNVSHTGVQTRRYTYTSAHAATKAILTLAYGATQSVAFLDPTRIDNSLGQPIFSYAGVITTSFNWSNDLGYGNILPTAGGESVTVAGITKDNAGTALGSCDVYLFRDNGNDTPTYIAYQESNSVTGAYSFTVFPGSAYFVVAFKGGATPVMDVTDRTVTAV